MMWCTVFFWSIVDYHNGKIVNGIKGECSIDKGHWYWVVYILDTFVLN